MKHLFILLLSCLLIVSCSSEYDGISPEEYIAKNSLDAKELENGVFIVIHEQGNDVKPKLTDVVLVDYVGKLAKDDFNFSASDDFTSVLGNLIPGWYVGLKEIGIGGSCTLIIPPSMGYGNTDVGSIPGKSVLIFDIELKDIFNSTTVEGYIERNDLETKELGGGVHIVIHEEGNSTHPTLVNNVVVNYTGKLTNEIVFDKGLMADLKLSKLIEGWKIGLPEIGEGGSCTLIVPSAAGYGDQPVGSIPANSPLVFDIELIEVK